jgi:hypothetical protein
MPTVTQVLTVQPAPGKFQQCLELGRKWKKIRERAGAKERMYTNTGGALFIVGEITAKVRADRDAQALLAEMRSNSSPVGTIVNVDLVEEVD